MVWRWLPTLAHVVSPLPHQRSIAVSCQPYPHVYAPGVCTRYDVCCRAIVFPGPTNYTATLLPVETRCVGLLPCSSPPTPILSSLAPWLAAADATTNCDGNGREPSVPDAANGPAICPTPPTAAWPHGWGVCERAARIMASAADGKVQ